MKQKIWFVFLLCLLKGFQSVSINKTGKMKLVIDHDGGADDAMAIFMSLLYEKYFNGPEVVALTITHGNVNESQAFVNTQKILDKAKRRDVKIYRGATKALITQMPSDNFFGVDGLGDLDEGKYKSICAQKEHAAFALIELSKKYENNLVIMAIGSVTNIALAVRLDPNFIGRLKQLYIGAGTIYSENTTAPEYNVEMDPEGYFIAVDDASVDKVTVLPFSEIKRTLNLSKEWREDVLGTIPTPIMEAQNSYERISLASSDRWTLLDPAVAAIVLDNAMVDKFKNSSNSVILCGDKRGINTNDFESNEPNVRLVYSARKDYYQKLLMDIFSADLK